MLLVQGDVFLTRKQYVPEDAHRVSRTNIGYILATAQTTGHAYVIEEDIELYENHGVLYVKTDRSVYLKNDQYKAVEVDEGIWEVCRFRDDSIPDEGQYFFLN
ncbi:MAG: hypothetical protein SFH39_11980 [Candidatus Magnetobacterium sp. LHC-1]|uniref:hypothetical protein n=1 Tax=Candidatus Magnetobacterium casense TaxID=1455061 RepID=UPI00058ED09F|nr:hypothetical protein [Candidatus Magnetobacterium casensis]MBF0336294.1 hypothetical protein [Nitrospirota bacterium]MBF0606571.1 hypothetical protein [Nitrospirota bacterium]